MVSRVRGLPRAASCSELRTSGHLLDNVEADLPAYTLQGYWLEWAVKHGHDLLYVGGEFRRLT